MSGRDSTNGMLINWCVAGPWHRHGSKLILSVKTSRRITGRDQNMYCQHSNASGVHKNVKDNLSCPKCHVKQREEEKAPFWGKDYSPSQVKPLKAGAPQFTRNVASPQLFPHSSKVRIFKFYLWLKRSRLLVSTRACGFQLWRVHKPLWG